MTQNSLLHTITKRLAGIAAGTFLLLIIAAPALAQAATSSADAPLVRKKTLMDHFHEGGWVMYPILVCSIGTAYLCWEGFNRTSLKKMAPPVHEEQVKSLFRAGDYIGAYDYCKNNPSPFTNTLRVGLSMLGEGKALTEESMFQQLNKEQSMISTFLSYLSVIGVTTPMIGLTGTVTGMMRAFEGLGTEGIGDPSKLAAAIGEVLVATLSGLAIAVPAFMAYYWLRARMVNGIHHVQDIINDLFRKMPWDALQGAHIGDEELYAALPAWSTDQAPAATL
ncbi:MAG: MotA/TolQ/ExbB proton channel family protein [Verrucomicrobiales bacterium]